jgi:NAD(P)-dependent dehydrogenase (short-subunit alcohol dehydrogenase family)
VSRWQERCQNGRDRIGGQGILPLTELLLDITSEAGLERLRHTVEADARGLDLLVHSAGIIHRNPMESARVEDLDAQFAVNVRAPYLITQRLLHLLTQAQGQVVFINSSVALAPGQPDIGQYGASKHALRAIADGTRQELNKRNIRVLSLFLGRTATPMQESLYRLQGKDYRPETLMQPEDVATMLIAAITLPRTAEVTDISIRPMTNPQ